MFVLGADFTVETTAKQPASLMETTSDWILQNLQNVAKPSLKQTDEYVSSLTMTDQDQVIVDGLTMGQADNPAWHLHRRGRITGTVMRRVFTKMSSVAKGKCDSADELVKTIVGESKFHGNKAKQYGTANKTMQSGLTPQ